MKARALLAAAGAVLVLGGCSQPGPAPDPSPGPSEESVLPLPPGEIMPPKTPPRDAPSAGTSPAAVTAGPLTPADLPDEVLGFAAQERPPAENEYVPNGTWTHEVAGERAGWEAMPTCPGNTGGGWPAAAFALAGTYLDDRDRPGNGLLLQFGSAGDATAYFDTYLAVLASCPATDAMPAAQRVAAGEGWYAGRRDYGGERWSEVVARRGDRVALIIVNDDDAASEAQLRGLGERLSR